jgi:hypothetical protein
MITEQRFLSTGGGGSLPLNIGFTFTGSSTGEETYVLAGSGT